MRPFRRLDLTTDPSGGTASSAGVRFHHEHAMLLGAIGSTSMRRLLGDSIAASHRLSQAQSRPGRSSSACSVLAVGRRPRRRLVADHCVLAARGRRLSSPVVAISRRGVTRLRPLEWLPLAMAALMVTPASRT